MNPKVLTVTIRAAVVVLTLILIWLLFAPKSYGQFKPAPQKPCICGADSVLRPNPKYYKQRYGDGSVRMLPVKVEETAKAVVASVDSFYSANNVKFSNRTKNPILITLGDQEYVVWRGKVYIKVNQK